MVKVVITGDLQVTSIDIDPAAVDPDDVEMLQDMVAAAVNEAIRAAQELAARRMARDHRRHEHPGPDVADALRPAHRAPARGARAAARHRPEVGAAHRVLAADGRVRRRRAARRGDRRGEAHHPLLPACASTSPRASCAASAPTRERDRDGDLRRRGAARPRRRRAHRRVPRRLPRARRARSRPSTASAPSSCASASSSTGSATGEITEVVVATNPNVEGETTALYLARLIKPLGIKVTRIASGLPVGGDLEYADEVTLGRALEARREM